MNNKKTLKKLDNLIIIGNFFKFLGICSFPIFLFSWIWFDVYISFKFFFASLIIYYLGKFLILSAYELKEQIKKTEMPD